MYKLCKNIEENLKLIYSNVPNNNNFITRNITLKGNIKCSILYINGLVNQSYVEDSIIYPLLFKIDEKLDISSPLYNCLSEKYISSYSTQYTDDLNTIANALKRGKCIILIENNNMCIICNTKGGTHRAITQSDIETNIRGGKESFVENIEMNIAIIQQKLKNNNFKMENFIIGENSETDVVLMYIDNIIDQTVLNTIKDKLKSIKSKYIPDTGYISQYIESHKFSLFPQTKTTEKPDKAISDMLQGKAVIMINGSPQVIVLPVVFIEFFQGFEDYSNRIYLANFDRSLRLFTAFIILTLSPTYLVLLQYNVELLPLSLIKIIINSRLGIPFNPFLEILSMQLLIEFLREGGLRLPTPIGQTLGIVGGIVIGNAATEAGLVSPTTLVIVAIGVISTFLIPNYEMTLTLRLLQFPLLISAQLLGFFGIIVGLQFILVSLVSMDSFGIPYFSPFAPFRGKSLKDTILRFSLNSLYNLPNIFKYPKNKGNTNE